MNRPYQALAAMLALLTGSAVAVSPARCHSATAQAAQSSRSLCASAEPTYFVGTNIFVLVVEDAGLEAGTAGQGSENIVEETVTQDTLPNYEDSCGYDRNRGEYYHPEDSEWFPSTPIVGTFAEECEAWPTEERLNQRFAEFANPPAVCGGNELSCPYFSDCPAEMQEIAEIDCGDGSERLNDESAFFGDDESWKTAPVEMPNWIDDYVRGNTSSPAVANPLQEKAQLNSIEEQYAAAEMEAARAAGMNLIQGPALAEAFPNRADYCREYESLFELDTILAAADSSNEILADDDCMAGSNANAIELTADLILEGTHPAAVIDRPISRLFSGLWLMFEEFLPRMEDDAAELYDSAHNALLQLNDLAEQATFALPAPAEAVYAARVQADERAWANHSLPEEAAESREMLTSLATGLRQAGEILFALADQMEADARAVLSAQHK